MTFESGVQYVRNIVVLCQFFVIIVEFLFISVFVIWELYILENWNLDVTVFNKRPSLS